MLRVWWPDDHGDRLLHATTSRCLPITVRGAWRACLSVGHRATLAEAAAVQAAAVRVALAGADAAARSRYDTCDDRRLFARYVGQDDAYEVLLCAGAAHADSRRGAA